MDTNTKMRNRAFAKQALAILSRHLAAGERLTRAELIDKTLASRPPCYFVSLDKVSHALHMLELHPQPIPGSERQAMYLEISQRVRELTEGPRQLKRHQAISFVLNFMQPSRYFISPRSACRILSALVRTRQYAYAT